MEKFQLGNTGYDPTIRTENDRIPARFGHLNTLVDAITELQQVPPGSGIASVEAGTNVTVDDTDPLNPIVNAVWDAQSGTYTPIVSGVVNAITATPNSATFIKVGSIVYCSIQLEITMDAEETTGSFELSLPVASDFASPKNLFGLMQCSTGGTLLAEIVAIDINAETTNNTCFVSLETATANANIQYVNMQFQYEIVS